MRLGGRDSFVKEIYDSILSTSLNRNDLRLWRIRNDLQPLLLPLDLPNVNDKRSLSHRLVLDHLNERNLPLLNLNDQTGT